MRAVGPAAFRSAPATATPSATRSRHAGFLYVTRSHETDPVAPRWPTSDHRAARFGPRWPRGRRRDSSRRLSPGGSRCGRTASTRKQSVQFSACPPRRNRCRPVLYRAAVCCRTARNRGICAACEACIDVRHDFSVAISMLRSQRDRAGLRPARHAVRRPSRCRSSHCPLPQDNDFVRLSADGPPCLRRKSVSRSIACPVTTSSARAEEESRRSATNLTTGRRRPPRSPVPPSRRPSNTDRHRHVALAG